MDIEKRIKLKLQGFPSTFDIENDIQQLPRPYIEIRLKKLLKDTSSSPLDTAMEKCRIWNLISFLSYILNDVESALEYNQKALEIASDNMIALKNKVLILLNEKDNFREIDNLSKQLNGLKENQWLFIESKAEIAYSLSKLGIQFYGKVCELYKHTLEECKTEKSSNVTKMTYHAAEILNWKFGMTLIERRLLNFHNTKDQTFSRLSDIRTYNRIAESFVDIIQTKYEKRCLSISRLKARSFVELGLLVRSTERLKHLFSDGVKDLLPDHREMWEDTDYFFDKAIEIFPEDIFVLEKSGQYFRYVKHIDKSISLLTQALKVGESSFAHHHLALSLKRKLQMIPSLHFPSPKKTSLLEQVPSRQDMISRHAEARVTNRHAAAPVPYDEEMFSRNNGCRGKFANTRCTQQKSSRFFTRKAYNESRTATDFSNRLENITLRTNMGSSPNDFIPLHRSSYPHVQIHKNISRHQGSEIALPRGTYRAVSSRSRNEYHRCFSDTQQAVINRIQHSNNNWDKPHRNTQRGQSLDENDFRPEVCITNQQYAMKLMIKSPRTPMYIDKNADKETIADILYHFNKSYEMVGNYAALYDKGLFYRELKNPKEAVMAFKEMIKNKTKQCSPLQLANAYEQAGLCLYDILQNKQECESDRSKSLEIDMKVYLKSSIEISCGIVEKIPYLKDCWESVPTLTSVLKNQAKTKQEEKERLKELADLYEKLQNYSEAVTILQELRSFADDETEEAEIVRDIVNQHMNEGNYDEAAFDLKLCISLSSRSHSLIDDDICLKVLLKGGIAALKAGHKEIGRNRLMSALSWEDHTGITRENIKNVEDQELDEKDTEFDIFILCDEDIEDKGEKLKSILSVFEIKATVNTKDGMPGNPTLKIMENFVSSAKHVVVLYEKASQTSELFAMYFASVQEWTSGNIVVVTSCLESELPPVMACCTSIQFGFDSEFPVAESLLQDDKVCNKVEEILTKLSAKRFLKKRKS